MNFLIDYDDEKEVLKRAGESGKTAEKPPKSNPIMAAKQGYHTGYHPFAPPQECVGDHPALHPMSASKVTHGTIETAHDFMNRLSRMFLSCLVAT